MLEGKENPVLDFGGICLIWFSSPLLTEDQSLQFQKESWPTPTHSMCVKEVLHQPSELEIGNNSIIDWSWRLALHSNNNCVHCDCVFCIFLSLNKELGCYELEKGAHSVVITSNVLF